MQLTRIQMRAVTLLSASDNVRTDTAIEEDQFKAEVTRRSGVLL